jgi:hypothetical protein
LGEPHGTMRHMGKVQFTTRLAPHGPAASWSA